MGPAEDAELDCKPPVRKSAVGETEPQSDLLAICVDTFYHLSYIYIHRWGSLFFLTGSCVQNNARCFLHS